MKLNSVDRKVNVLYNSFKVVDEQTSYHLSDFIQHNLEQIYDNKNYMVQDEIKFGRS